MAAPSPRTKWLVTIAAPWAALLALELGLRLCGFEQPPVEVPLVVWNADQDLDLGRATALHQADRDALWVPRPGALVLEGSDERIGASGFRGPQPAARRDPSLLRVVLLGESSIFGTSVPWDQTCAPRLRAALAARGVRAEIVNAGVIGHTASQGVGRYRSAVRPLRADAVVIAYGAQNEQSRSQGPGDREKLELASRQDGGGRPLWFALSRRLRVLQLANWVLLRRELPELQREIEEQRRHPRHPDRVGQPDWPGVRRVPLAEFEAALRELCADVVADGARPILCSLPRTPENEARLPVLPLYSEAIARVGRELGVPVVDLRAAVFRAVEAGAGAGSFFVATDTWHLGPKGQGLLAQLLADALVPPAAR